MFAACCAVQGSFCKVVRVSSFILLGENTLKQNKSLNTEEFGSFRQKYIKRSINEIRCVKIKTSKIQTWNYLMTFKAHF